MDERGRGTRFVQVLPIVAAIPSDMSSLEKQLTTILVDSITSRSTGELAKETLFYLLSPRTVSFGRPAVGDDPVGVLGTDRLVPVHRPIYQERFPTPATLFYLRSIIG